MTYNKIDSSGVSSTQNRLGSHSISNYCDTVYTVLEDPRSILICQKNSFFLKKLNIGLQNPLTVKNLQNKLNMLKSPWTSNIKHEKLPKPKCMLKVNVQILFKGVCGKISTNCTNWINYDLKGL